MAAERACRLCCDTQSAAPARGGTRPLFLKRNSAAPGTARLRGLVGPGAGRGRCLRGLRVPRVRKALLHTAAHVGRPGLGQRACCSGCWPVERARMRVLAWVHAGGGRACGCAARGSVPVVGAGVGRCARNGAQGAGIACTGGGLSGMCGPRGRVCGRADGQHEGGCRRRRRTQTAAGAATGPPGSAAYRALR